MALDSPRCWRSSRATHNEITIYRQLPWCHADWLYWGFWWRFNDYNAFPDSKVHGTNMRPIWADMTQVGPMLAPWTLLSGLLTKLVWCGGHRRRVYWRLLPATPREKTLYFRKAGVWGIRDLHCFSVPHTLGDQGNGWAITFVVV